MFVTHSCIDYTKYWIQQSSAAFHFLITVSSDVHMTSRLNSQWSLWLRQFCSGDQGMTFCATLTILDPHITGRTDSRAQLMIALSQEKGATGVEVHDVDLCPLSFCICCCSDGSSQCGQRAIYRLSRSILVVTYCCTRIRNQTVLLFHFLSFAPFTSPLIYISITGPPCWFWNIPASWDFSALRDALGMSICHWRILKFAFWCLTRK